MSDKKPPRFETVDPNAINLGGGNIAKEHHRRTYPGTVLTMDELRELIRKQDEKESEGINQVLKP